MRSTTEHNILSIFTPNMLACAFAFAAMKVAGALTNGYLYALVASSEGWIREASTLVITATFIAITLVAYRRPQVVNARSAVTLACTFSLAAVVLVVGGLAVNSMTLISLGIFARSAGRALTICLLALCLVQLESNKQVGFAIALGLFVFSVLDLFRAALGTTLNAMIVIGVIQIAVALWTAKPASRVLDVTSAGDSVDDLKLADPTAFLPMFHGVFVCILLFSASSGFALTFNEVAGAPPTLLLNTPLLVVLLLFLLFTWGNKREDTLFSLSVLIVMAGFLTTPLSFNGTFANTSGTLLRFGQQCFEVLAWTVIMAVGRRNVYGCLVSVGVMQTMSSIGTLIGAVSGHVTNTFVQTDFFMATGFALTMVFVFFTFLWCGFRTFSFSDAIASVTAVGRPSASNPVLPAITFEQLSEEDAKDDIGAAEGSDAAQNAARGIASDGEDAAAGRNATSGSTAAPSDAATAMRTEHTPSASASPAPMASAPDIAASTSVLVASANPVSPTLAAAGADAAFASAGASAAASESTTPAASAATPAAEAAAPAADALEESCARLSKQFGLTEREREVFGLLAHGRNGRYIMDHLVISRNTAKSHIKHIYSKLGVHSHQELIDLATNAANQQ